MTYNMVSFADYQGQGGELNELEFNTVRDYEPVGDEVTIQKMRLHMGFLGARLDYLTKDQDNELAARIYCALGDRVPNLPVTGFITAAGITDIVWLLKETYRFQGKDPSAIDEAKLRQL